MTPGGIFVIPFAPAVPVSVWEQVGVIVLLFLIVIPGVFAAVRFLLNDQRKAQLSSQQTLLAQQQEFIEKRDQQWQEFLEVQRASDREAREQDRAQTAGIAKILEQLTEKVEGLAEVFGSHDTWERTKLDDMQRNLSERPKKAPRG